MKISVVTTCLNSAKTIGYTLDSFRRQSYPSKEILIVDGGSHDDTLKIVEQYSDIGARVVPQSVTGIFNAMNRGLEVFSGDVVGFLNSDDAFHDDDALRRIADALQRSDIVYGDIVMVENHRTKWPVRTWRAGGFDRRALRRGWAPPHPSFYVRRRVIDRIGGFDLRYRLASDYDFMLRALIDESFTVAHVPNTLVDFQVGGSSTRSLAAVIRGNLESSRARRAHLSVPLLDAGLLLKPLSKMGQLHWRSPAAPARAPNALKNISRQ